MDDIIAKNLSVSTREISSDIKDKTLLDLHETTKNKKLYFVTLKAILPHPVVVLILSSLKTLVIYT